MRLVLDWITRILAGFCGLGLLASIFFGWEKELRLFAVLSILSNA